MWWSFLEAIKHISHTTTLKARTQTCTVHPQTVHTWSTEMILKESLFHQIWTTPVFWSIFWPFHCTILAYIRLLIVLGLNYFTNYSIWNYCKYLKWQFNVTVNQTYSCFGWCMSWYQVIFAIKCVWSLSGIICYMYLRCLMVLAGVLCSQMFSVSSISLELHKNLCSGVLY